MVTVTGPVDRSTRSVRTTIRGSRQVGVGPEPLALAAGFSSDVAIVVCLAIGSVAIFQEWEGGAMITEFAVALGRALLDEHSDALHVLIVCPTRSRVHLGENGSGW
jgi:hypothetical protein